MGQELINLDLYNSLTNFPSEIVKDSKIIISTYSKIKKLLEPCEKCLIPTGVKIPIFFPISHTLRFQGVKNSFNIETFSQVISPSGEELKILVANFNDTPSFICTNMPLGHIIIEPVLE
jgi:dUTPase